MPHSRSDELGRSGRDGSGHDGGAISKLTSTGSPEAQEAAAASPAEERTRDELYLMAAALGINGRSRMTKDSLAYAIREHLAREAAGKGKESA